MKTKKLLCIIPARGGSKGIPKKNILDFNGKPLIYWTIQAALNSEKITDLYFSSDCDDVIECAKKCGISSPKKRPKELALDSSKTHDLVIHILQEEKSQQRYYEEIMILEPTHPIRKKTDIDNAISSFRDGDNFDCLVSICESKRQLATNFELNKSSELKQAIQKEIIFRRQEEEKLFQPYGGIFLAKTDSFLKNKSFYAGKVMGYKLDNFQAYDIDEPHDFVAAESVLIWAMKNNEI